MNAVKLFNDMNADELIFLDIDATKENRSIDFNLIKKISNEAFMPFSVGGGISTVEHTQKCFENGADKVIVNTSALDNPYILSEISNIFGKQSLVVSVDVKKGFFGGYKVMKHSGNVQSNVNLVDWIKKVCKIGVGEIMLTSISNEGTMKGYDYDLIKLVSDISTVPIIASGGAGNLVHLQRAVKNGAHAVSAGSLFVYHGPRNAVLINYPQINEINQIFIK
jgi:cyclase